ncbi:MAG: 3-deoxy-7-phosphoheptulonate synthase, partial [Clostridia bacterium]|nr:3-deoxy-7-phosphoheptulonate synthase [Clostridia bacterium]
MNMTFRRKLPLPKELKEAHPIPEAARPVVDERRRALRAVFDGQSDRFLLIVGPCSADRADSVLAYLSRLKSLESELGQGVFVIPRLFTIKPRSDARSYKGMLHQPDPTERPDLLRGLVASRELHLRALCDFGYTCADEMLYPDDHRYLSDLLAYVTVGARSVEDQQHRLTASGLDIPVGMKNPTHGDLTAMKNAVLAAHLPHTFLYRGWEVHSHGNPYAHAVLRGCVENGEHRPNYDTDILLSLLKDARQSALPHPAVVVDCSHSNSGKDPDRQRDVAASVLASRRRHPELKGFVKGLMIESYLLDGAQPADGGLFGCSITDPCLGWDKTRDLLLRIADALCNLLRSHGVRVAYHLAELRKAVH